MRSSILAGFDDWKIWIKSGQSVHTRTRGTLLLVRSVTKDHIELRAKNDRKIRLQFDHLDALWRQRERVNAGIPPGHGKVSLNTMANRIWQEGSLAADNVNESYYWAVVCERTTREGGLLGLDPDYEAAEGNPVLAQHLRYERNRTLVAKKKRAVLEQTRNLKCEACGFDYLECYLDLGENFCEVHHGVPLAKGKRMTSLKNLHILCANCHRMIHRTKPMDSIEAFRKRLSGWSQPLLAKAAMH
jgi:hypothetical protein